MNNRITPKERNLLKGAIRRVFSRSDLRKLAIATSIIEHFEPKRSRVKKWSLCPKCINKVPTYLMQVDHKEPIVPVEVTLEDMTWDEVINRTWCHIVGLEAICKDCHTFKTKAENKLRRANRRSNKK